MFWGGLIGSGLFHIRNQKVKVNSSEQTRNDSAVRDVASELGIERGADA
jgi:hypothetical protein